MLKGCAVSGGFALGKVYKIEQQKHTIRHTYASVQEEHRRFEKALEELTCQTQAVCTRIRSILGEREANIFQGHIYIAKDPEISKEIKEKIARGFSAEMAAESACDVYIEKFLTSEQEFVRQRAADIRDVKNSFLSALCSGGQPQRSIPAGSVIAARELTPSAVTFLDRRRTAAVLTETGGRNCHLAILLRAMGIPAVFSVEHLMRHLYTGQKVIVDGDKGEIIEIN